jgi:hypothetical protein
MRIHELLNEARTIHLDPDEVMSVKVPIRVWANPRHVEVLEWLKTGDLRGLITPTSLFVFDAWILAHDVVMDGLIETGEIPMAQSGEVVRCIVTSADRDFSQFDTWEDDKESPMTLNGISMAIVGPQEVFSYPSVKKAFGIRPAITD